MALRFLLAKDARLFSKVLRLFVRALFAYQRRRARKLGVFAPLPGAVVFLQRFGSALQLTPHVHLVAPDGLFLKDAQGTLHFCPLSPPTDEDVEALLHKVALRTVALLRDAGKLDDAEPQEDALDFLRAQSTRTKRLPFLEWTPPRNGRRCAFLEGFSLHANSRVHENDRQGLLRLANYGARGPFSLERLSQLPNGDLAYRMKRPSASGAHVLVLSPLALLRKLAALVPPPRVNLVRFFGVFAPNARVRKRVVPKTTTKDDMPAVGCHDSGEFAESMGHTPTRPKRTSRIPWAQLLKRTFAKDVLACDKCGGERRIVAYVTAQATVREILRHLGLPSQALPQARAQDSPQLELYA